MPNEIIITKELVEIVLGYNPKMLQDVRTFGLLGKNISYLKNKDNIRKLAFSRGLQSIWDLHEDADGRIFRLVLCEAKENNIVAITLKQISYDDNGRIKAVWSKVPDKERPDVLKYEYDQDGHLKAMTEEEGRPFMSFERDDMGRIVHQINHPGMKFITYDDRGLIKRARSSFSEYSYKYDETGNMTEVDFSYQKKKPKRFNFEAAGYESEDGFVVESVLQDKEVVYGFLS